MTAVLGIDCETASRADLKSVGAWRYSLDPSTIVYCVVTGWVCDGRIETAAWTPGMPAPPPWVCEFLADRDWLAHSCSFEKAIWQNVLTPRYGWPEMPARWEDTQAHAAAANLPVTLEGLGAAIGAPVQKDVEGGDLMKKMCWLDEHGRNPHDTPENRARLLQYCETDVRSMLAIWQRLPKMIPSEAALWQLDQKINHRGLFLDRPFVAKLEDMAELRRRQLLLAASGLDENIFFPATKTPAVKKWLTEKGVELPKQKRVRVTGEQHESESIGRQAALVLAAAEDVDPTVKALLENRLEASKLTSLAKLRKVEQLVDPRDGRLRNALQFCAAHTGRWSSRGLQVHNLARPRKGDTPEEKALLKRAYQAVLDGDYYKLMEICDEAA